MADIPQPPPTPDTAEPPTPDIPPPGIQPPDAAPPAAFLSNPAIAAQVQSMAQDIPGFTVEQLWQYMTPEDREIWQN
jgi:hypothetical protein